MVSLVSGQWVRMRRTRRRIWPRTSRPDGVFPGSQQHRHRARGGGVVDMDRQEAAFAVMRVEQRELLLAMHDVEGVVDVQRHLARRAGVAGAVDVDHGVAHGRHFAPRRRVLPARHGRLGAQILAAVGQPPAGQLERGIGAQIVEIVAVLVAAGDSEDARTQDVGNTVRHPIRVARVGDQRRQLVCNAQAALGGSKQHHAAIRCEPPAIERGGDFLASDGWEIKRQEGIFGHGGRGSYDGVEELVSTPNSVNAINALRHTRQRTSVMCLNKTG